MYALSNNYCIIPRATPSGLRNITSRAYTSKTPTIVCYSPTYGLPLVVLVYETSLEFTGGKRSPNPPPRPGHPLCIGDAVLHFIYVLYV